MQGNANTILVKRKEEHMKMRKIKRFLSAALIAVMSLSLTACGGENKGSADAGKQKTKDKTVVNIGCTATLGSMNPLIMDATWVNLYATGLEFLPLVTLTDSLEFEYMLAANISTEDNLTYKIELNPEAKWSDGKPVTAEDLEFTLCCLASPKVMHNNMIMSAIAGTDDESGWIAEGADSMEGLKIVDEHTLNMTFKSEINMTGFMNGYAQYIQVLPKHEISKIPEAELAYSEWFEKPTVVLPVYSDRT